jgi:hypothetical protein
MQIIRSKRGETRRANMQAGTNSWHIQKFVQIHLEAKTAGARIRVSIESLDKVAMCPFLMATVLS